MSVQKLILASIAAAGMAASAQAATIINGSFEIGFQPGSYTGVNASQNVLVKPTGVSQLPGMALSQGQDPIPTITGWTVTAGTIDYIGSYWSASDGNRSIDLNGTTPGAISQTLQTIAGATYTLTFDLASNPDNLDTKSVIVHFGDSSQTVVYDGVITPAMDWRTYSLSFTATGASTLLTFASGNSGAWGAALDNVRISNGISGDLSGDVVAAVPEPTTWAMLITGFGMVGFAARRRKTAQGVA